MEKPIIMRGRKEMVGGRGVQIFLMQLPGMIETRLLNGGRGLLHPRVQFRGMN